MDLSYFQKINNTYKSNSKQETDLYLLNRQVNIGFDDTIDYHKVKRNGEPFELLIIRDTDTNATQKKIKSKNEDYFNLGDYIEWDNKMWIVTLLDPDDKTYHSGYMYLCELLLRWQNSNGEIIERWCYSEDFTKYSNGVTGNNTITVGDNQYGLTICVDEETKKLKRDMRFPIDFDDSVEPDIYKLTNRKTHLSNNLYFNRGAVLNLTMTLDFFDRNTDKKVTMEDGREVWVCSYNSNIDSPIVSDKPQEEEKADFIATISGNTKLKNEYSRSYTALFKDGDGKEISADEVLYEWRVVSDFPIEQEVMGNKIKLSVNNEDLIDRKFVLQLIVGGKVACETEIKIVE